MSVSVNAIRPAVVVPPPSSFTITLSAYDAQVLRTMLGGLKLKTRGGATAKNGGGRAEVARSKTLTKEIFTALEAQGAAKFNRRGQR
jgi:hypothetical protein